MRLIFPQLNISTSDYVGVAISRFTCEDEQFPLLKATCSEGLSKELQSFSSVAGRDARFPWLEVSRTCTDLDGLWLSVAEFDLLPTLFDENVFWMVVFF
mmetsp:Transcript_104938/g.186649  ORF Transcript_104938/g.186649 Transcript_104938/m.186649 type:complete len:99 (+) Transcript_104938:349-645(+)